MNAENLAIENLESLTPQPSADYPVESTPEITLLSLDSFRFIGGGGGSVLD